MSPTWNSFHFVSCVRARALNAQPSPGQIHISGLSLFPFFAFIMIAYAVWFFGWRGSRRRAQYESVNESELKPLNV